jgi:hypothetical protein
MTAPIAFRLERIAGWALHPLESAAFSRRTPIPAIRRTFNRTTKSDPRATFERRNDSPL